MYEVLYVRVCLICNGTYLHDTCMVIQHSGLVYFKVGCMQVKMFGNKIHHTVLTLLSLHSLLKIQTN